MKIAIRYIDWETYENNGYTEYRTNSNAFIGSRYYENTSLKNILEALKYMRYEEIPLTFDEDERMPSNKHLADRIKQGAEWKIYDFNVHSFALAEGGLEALEGTKPDNMLTVRVYLEEVY